MLLPLLATKLIYPRGANKAQHTYFFSSKEDHTYVRGEIYQRVIAIRKSKKDSKVTKGQTTILKDL